MLSGLQLDCLPDKDMSCVKDYTKIVEAITAQVIGAFLDLIALRVGGHYGI